MLEHLSKKGLFHLFIGLAVGHVYRLILLMGQLGQGGCIGEVGILSMRRIHCGLRSGRGSEWLIGFVGAGHVMILRTFCWRSVVKVQYLIFQS